MKRLIKKLRARLYNKKHNTNIFSAKASLDAVYGKEVLIGDDTVVTSDVIIGDYSYVNCNSSIENCVIGKYCSISSGVYINPHEHAIDFRSTHPFCDRGREKQPQVVIGNDVLISLNCIILKGVTIGNGAVIAAGAVVTKNVLPYEIVGGVPAKHIGWRFDEEERQRLQELEWWNFDREYLQQRQQFFSNKTDEFEQ